ncbi:MAG TPA: hypothetical protein VGD36_01020, partial [Xanthobacteraceae bacterium]
GRRKKCPRQNAQEIHEQVQNDVERERRKLRVQPALTMKEASTSRFHSSPAPARASSLALLWEDVDFVSNKIRICRMQELDGTITERSRPSR